MSDKVDYAAQLRNMMARDPVHQAFERGDKAWGNYAVEQNEIQEHERDARHAQGIYTPEEQTPAPPRETVPAYLPYARRLPLRRGPPPGQWSRGPPRYSRRRSPSRTPPRYSRRRSPSHTPPRYSRRRSPSRTPPRYSRRRSPSHTPPRYSRRRSPSHTPPRYSPRRRSRSVNSFGRRLSYSPPRQSRRLYLSPRRNGSVNSFGRNMSYVPPRAVRRPRFFNNATSTYRVRPRFFNNASGTYLTPPSPV